MNERKEILFRFRNSHGFGRAEDQTGVGISKVLQPNFEGLLAAVFLNFNY